MAIMIAVRSQSSFISLPPRVITPLRRKYSVPTAVTVRSLNCHRRALGADTQRPSLFILVQRAAPEKAIHGRLHYVGKPANVDQSLPGCFAEIGPGSARSGFNPCGEQPSMSRVPSQSSSTKAGHRTYIRFCMPRLPKILFSSGRHAPTWRLVGAGQERQSFVLNRSLVVTLASYLLKLSCFPRRNRPLVYSNVRIS